MTNENSGEVDVFTEYEIKAIKVLRFIRKHYKFFIGLIFGFIIGWAI